MMRATCRESDECDNHGGPRSRSVHHESTAWPTGGRDALAIGTFVACVAAVAESSAQEVFQVDRYCAVGRCAEGKRTECRLRSVITRARWVSP